MMMEDDGLDDLDAIFDQSDDEDGDPEYDFMSDNPSLLASLSGMSGILLFQIKLRNLYFFLRLNFVISIILLSIILLIDKLPCITNILC